MRKGFFNSAMLMLILFLSVCSQGQGGIRQWTSPGDDGNVGYAAGHAMIWSLDSAAIVASDDGKNGWDLQPGVFLVTSPAMPTNTLAGSNVSVDVPVSTFPSDTVVFVSVKAFDDAVASGADRPNYSLLGKILRVRTPDTVGPASILDLR